MNPLSERKSPEQIYTTLRDEILTVVLRPGEAISETRMAARFGVSRTPVREIFKRLAEEGFLQVVPQVGTFVAAIDLTAVYDSQFVRETLECRTVVLAAERVEDPDRTVLAAYLAEQERTLRNKDRQAFHRSDDAFHAYLVRMAGHAVVWDVIEGVKAQLDRVRCLSLESETWRELMFTQHREIVDRVSSRDAARAEEAMRQHLRTVFEAIERIAKEHIDAFRSGNGRRAK